MLLSPKILKDIRTNHMPQERTLSFYTERTPEKEERKTTPKESLHPFPHNSTHGHTNSE